MIRSLLVVLASTAALAAQTLPVGFRDFPLRNRTSSGTPTLQARIYYPAQSAGQNAPVRQQPGGYPVYVFCHGNGHPGNLYISHGTLLAENGFVCVLIDTALSDSDLLYRDAVAHWVSLGAESKDPQSVFFGAFDLQRAAVGGYSMGGISAMRALASDCGYRAGFAHAPSGGSWLGPGEFTKNKHPFAIAHGLGDTLIPWQDAFQYWQNSKVYGGEKVFYLLNQEANHVNVASVPTLKDQPIFDRVMRVFLGFLTVHLKGDARGQDEVVGAAARAEPRLVAIHAEHEQPEFWVEQNGRDASLRFSAQPGGLLLLASLQTSWHATAFGGLLLDPGSLRLVWSTEVGQAGFARLDLAVPELAGLENWRLPLQALAVNRDRDARLTGLGFVTF